MQPGRLFPLIAPALLLVAVSCHVDEPTPRHFAQRRIDDAAASQLFYAAQAALQAEGFSIARADENAGIIMAEPLRSESVPSIGASKRVPQRTVAQVRYRRRAPGWEVFCKVNIEESDTEAYRLAYGDRTRSDLPGDQPGYLAGLEPDERNTVWTVVRRHREVEQRILNTIQELIRDTSVAPH